MTENSPSRRLYRVALFLATVWTLTTWIFLVDSNLFSQRERFQESDFIMTFYIAGRLMAEGRAGELYPPPGAASFVGTPFDHAAHDFLPHLAKSSIGAYMYTPLVAAFFAPFSLAGPNNALLVWQILSVLALALSCWCLYRITSLQAAEIFVFSFLYLPVFLTLWAGQLGLSFGLLPLSAGLLLLLCDRPLAAGVVWSFLLLKPQYFLAAAFTCLTLAIARLPRAFLGMAGGVVALLAITIGFFSPQLTWDWLQSHRVSDSIFSAGLHGIPGHLITGLPANLMILLPAELRDSVKWLLYAGAALLWVAGLVFVLKLPRANLGDKNWISFVATTGIVLCSLALPHLLYYDLCVLLPAGVLLLARDDGLFSAMGSRDLALIGWFSVSGFLPILVTFSGWRILPLVLEFILLALSIVLLTRVRRTVCARRIAPARA